MGYKNHKKRVVVETTHPNAAMREKNLIITIVNNLMENKLIACMLKLIDK